MHTTLVARLGPLLKQSAKMRYGVSPVACTVVALDKSAAYMSAVRAFTCGTLTDKSSSSAVITCTARAR